MSFIIGVEGAPLMSGVRQQQPVALLERIIQASSNEGDVVLDPFCGCGTTIAAAGCGSASTKFLRALPLDER